MSKLVPKIQADKNGKLVTRHVNPSKGTIKSKSTIPKPTKRFDEEPVASSSSGLSETAHKQISDAYEKYVGISLYSTLLSHLDSIDDDVLKEYEPLVENDAYATLLLSVMAQGDDSNKARGLLFVAKHVEELSPQWDFEESIGYQDCETIFNGLSAPSYSEHVDQYNGTARFDNVDSDSLNALVKATYALSYSRYCKDDSSSKSLSIKDPEVVDVVARHPDKVDQIIDMLLMDKLNIDIVALRISAEVQPLREGLL